MKILTKFLRSYKADCITVEERKNFNEALKTFAKKDIDAISITDNFVRLVNSFKDEKAAIKKLESIPSAGAFLIVSTIILNSKRFPGITLSWILEGAEKRKASQKLLDSFQESINDDQGVIEKFESQVKSEAKEVKLSPKFTPDDKDIMRATTCPSEPKALAQIEAIKDINKLYRRAVAFVKFGRFGNDPQLWVNRMAELGASEEDINEFANSITNFTNERTSKPVKYEAEKIILNIPKPKTQKPELPKGKPSDIKKLDAKKYKVPHKVIVGDVYDLSDYNRTTQDIQYYEAQGNGYIKDKEGVIYDVKVSDSSGDCGRIAGGSHSYYVTIYNVGPNDVTVSLSGYIGIMSGDGGGHICDDIRKGYYLEDYLAKNQRWMSYKTKELPEIKELISRGNPNATPFTKLKEQQDKYNAEMFDCRYFSINKLFGWRIDQSGKINLVPRLQGFDDEYAKNLTKAVEKAYLPLLDSWIDSVLVTKWVSRKDLAGLLVDSLLLVNSLNSWSFTKEIRLDQQTIKLVSCERKNEYSPWRLSKAPVKIYCAVDTRAWANGKECSNYLKSWVNFITVNKQKEEWDSWARKYKIIPGVTTIGNLISFRTFQFKTGAEWAYKEIKLSYKSTHGNNYKRANQLKQIYLDEKKYNLSKLPLTRLIGDYFLSIYWGIPELKKKIENYLISEEGFTEERLNNYYSGYFGLD